jgi:hypothetical protein
MWVSLVTVEVTEEPLASALTRRYAILNEIRILCLELLSRMFVLIRRVGY